MWCHAAAAGLERRREREVVSSTKLEAYLGFWVCSHQRKIKKNRRQTLFTIVGHGGPGQGGPREGGAKEGSQIQLFLHWRHPNASRVSQCDPRKQNGRAHPAWSTPGAHQQRKNTQHKRENKSGIHRKSHVHFHPQQHMSLASVLCIMLRSSG